ncbi:LacI family DNA-binding transcriptional regulator [uncultured Roseobacter sp.]|uniref:LacI family DNA-binding transcriptional regulator n=1 Tax=uncultured Roseobacter sp. TaxID=114847 RepID=UPI002617ADBA|nr:LacI family DNA-binding transcriptional regulator [uncultured Roseobacter sp.]
MPVSLKDVAKEAGLSPASVSRHLNGTLDLPVETRDRIEKAVQRLGYRPNPHARRLSLGRSDIITLVVPDIANPFFAVLASAIEKASSEKGKIVQLHATSSAEAREIAVLQMAADNRSDGVVFCTNHRPGDELAEALSDLPKVVIVDEAVNGANAPQIFADNEEGGYLAGRHFAQWKHRNIAYIGGHPELMSTQLRVDGLERGLRDGHAAAQTAVNKFFGTHDMFTGRALAAQMLDGNGGETGIFVGSDELAIGVIETLRARGIRIPEDMSLISFDGTRALHLYDPPITAVHQPAKQLGERAVQVLLDGDWSTGEILQQVELLPVELIERASVAAPNTT